MLLPKSQQRYPHYQKILLAIVMTSRKVSHYFNEHPFTIVSSAPLADILNNPGATGRVAEWNIELRPQDLQYKHPTAIKSQVLPDFLVEWTEGQTPGPQTYQAHGQCSSMGPRDNKELAQELYSSPPKEQS